MSIDRPDFDSITEADLRALLDNQRPEGLRLEYKQALYEDNSGGSLETMKDLSALANSHGGHIIIGIAEDNGLPIAMDGVVATDPDMEIRRIEQRMETGVEPSIPDIRIKSLRLASGNHCFIIRVPKSWRPPHRVSAQGKNRFYMRNSSGVYEPDVEGLRMLFTAGSDITQRVRQFKQERLEQVTSLQAAQPLNREAGRLIMHIIPFASLSSDIQINLDDAYQLHARLRPMATSTGMTPRFNFDGFINERGGRGRGYTQVFRNGIIEATRANIITRNQDSTEPKIPAIAFEEYIVQVLPGYMQALHDLQIPPPFAVTFILEGVRGTKYYVSGDDYGSDGDIPIIGRDPLFLPECIINAYGTDAEYHQAIKPAFDALWNAAGHSSAEWFNGPSGAWRNPQHGS